ncbi:hypothetical protein ACNKHT_22030 [Shigella flexneri]
MAARMSQRYGESQFCRTQRIITLLKRAGLPVNGPRNVREAHLPHMLRDKKVLAGEIRLILPLAIGKSEVRSGVYMSPFLTPSPIVNQRNNKKGQAAYQAVD